MNVQPTRRRFLAQTAGAGLALSAPLQFAQAQATSDWPRNPLKCVVPFAAGGATDALSRLIARGVSANLGQPVVIDNRGGAGGIPGTDAVAKAAPDGYTFGATTLTQLVSNQILYEKLPYDVERELSLLSLTATVPLVLCVHPSLPVSSAPELLAYLKRNKGKYSYGSYGTGNFGHLAAMHISESQDAGMVHAPYRGETPMLLDLIGGQIQMAFGSVLSIKPHVEAGKLKAIGITGSDRVKAMPNVPTLAEQGLSDDVYRMNPGWIAFIAPRQVPAAIQQRLASEIRTVTMLPDVREQITGMGFAPVGNTPEQFVAAYKAEFPVWRKLIKQAGVKPQS
ncbi:MAG: tripartite tricarboxylate transporter substrate binding protein [Comamonadaceae bacterium]|nr:MAG: tripartite tricarboxylate transporter substrate binding protein [Comamonadaceae bacterium]